MGFKKGVSLIELLVGFVIIGLITTLVAGLYMANSRIFSNQSATIDAASQNRIALDEITNQIRESEAVATSCTPCSGETTSTANILILRLWPIDSSGEPQDPGSSNHDYIVYRLDSTNPTDLIKKTYANAISSRQTGQKILAKNATTLSFTYSPDLNTATEVTLNLSIETQSLNQTHTLSESAKVQLRNK